MKKIISLIAFVIFILAIWFYKSHQKVSEITQEKVLVTIIHSQVLGLDPIRIRDDYAVHEAAKVYEGLLDYHYLKRPFELIPNLAESMPDISADQLVYTFKIRKGVLFHDNPCFPPGKGRELTAYDFVYALKRLADPKLQSLNFWLLDNKLKGLNEWRQKYTDATTVDYTQEIEGIKAIDRYTLQFTLNQVYPQFLYALTMAPCYAVAQEAVEYYGPEFTNHPVGTGPFLITYFNPQDTKIIYYKNPNFRDKRFPSEAAEKYQHMLVGYADKKLPFVDKIITYILPEEHPRWLKFQKGEVDIIDITRDHIASEVIRDGQLIPTIQERGVQLFQETVLGTSYIVFNNALPLFKDNLKLRQAISMAVDGEKYNNLFFKGSAMLAQSILPPGLAGYRPEYSNPNRVYDLQKAKQYLAEAGYPAGKGLPEITLDISSTTDARQKGEFFQACMKEIEINIKLIPNIFPELVKKINKKATMLHSIAWTAEYPDAENFYQLLYGPNQANGIGSNFDDPAFNDLYEKASLMTDSPARTLLYEQLNQMAAEKVPLIYMLHFPNLVLYQGWVKNYTFPDCICGIEQYFDVNLEEKRALLPKLKQGK
jgi:oligopeptide transport system substrate-binding protein